MAIDVSTLPENQLDDSMEEVSDARVCADLITANESRIALYQTLASIFYREFTQEQIDAMASSELPPESDDDTVKGIRGMIEFVRHSDSAIRQRLASDYAYTFLAAGTYEEQRAVPFESVYTSESGLLMQEARDEFLRLMNEVDMIIPVGYNEPEDHITFQYWYMEHLISRCNDALKAGDIEGAITWIEKQKRFHSEHMANWVDDFADAIERCAQTDFYISAALLLRGFVADEGEIIDEELDCLTDSDGNR